MGNQVSAKTPAGDRAYQHTKELILSGRLPGGHLFSEGDIATSLEISRTPVREAFLRLEAEELLRLIPKRGAIVVPVPPGDAEDVLDLREALESAAVRRIVRDERLLDEVAPRLSRSLTEQAACAERHDADAFAEADDAFHFGIVEAAGNALAIKFYVSLADRQRRMSLGVLKPKARQLDLVMSEHEGLAAKILARDTDGFASALRHHLDTNHRG
jgi:DNA-binding GntR family transcriptional regulator